MTLAISRSVKLGISLLPICSVDGMWVLSCKLLAVRLDRIRIGMKWYDMSDALRSW